MGLTLPPELESFVAQQLLEGQFASKDEVLIEGVRLLLQRQLDRQAKLEDLRREIALGIDDLENGKSAPFNQEILERIKARGRARLQNLEHEIAIGLEEADQGKVTPFSAVEILAELRARKGSATKSEK